MSSTKTVYITTPIYYVNGRPHIGSALTTLCCDMLARYHRMRGEPTWFLTGTDMQAAKNVEAAKEAGVPVREFVEGLADQFQQAWRDMNFSFDDFIRTTEDRHVRVVQEIFQRLKATGDIYLGEYEGWYCVSDETFFRDSDVEDDKLCPNEECRKPLDRVKEENYFFRLSAFGDRLLAHIEANPEFLQPEFRRNEVVAFIKQGLRDASVTRSNAEWGIPVPDEPDKVIYVWFDALINYLAATGWPDDEKRYRELWPADVHMMAKEIYVRFHATMWPAMLMALGLPLPKTVYAHGWWVGSGGKKEGKRTGGLPHPVAFAEELREMTGAKPEIAVDALRYLLAREMVFHGDTEFSRESFLKRYNTDLANDIGNLCNRSVNMVARYFDGVVPAPATQEPEIAEYAAQCVADYEAALAEFRFNAALESAWRLVSRMNRYIEERAPWSQAKKGQRDDLATTLYTCMEAVRLVAVLSAPAMPSASSALLKQVGWPYDDGLVGWQEATQWGALPPGVVAPAPEPLFPRIMESAPTGAAEADRKLPEPKQPNAAKPPKPVQDGGSQVTEQAASPAPAEAPVPTTSFITFEEFMKVELRVAKVLEAEPVPNTTKLLKLTVEVGAETRTILAGIAEMYQPDELVGKLVVVVANLQPRKMRGIESQGMLLAADADGQAIILQPETEVPTGTRVR